MEASPPTRASPENAPAPARRTTLGFAAIVALAATFPVALAAIEYPVVVAALLVAASTASAVVGKRR